MSDVIEDHDLGLSYTGRIRGAAGQRQSLAGLQAEHHAAEKQGLAAGRDRVFDGQVRERQGFAFDKGRGAADLVVNPGRRVHQLEPGAATAQGILRERGFLNGADAVGRCGKARHLKHGPGFGTTVETARSR